MHDAFDDAVSERDACSLLVYLGVDIFLVDIVDLTIGLKILASCQCQQCDQKRNSCHPFSPRLSGPLQLTTCNLHVQCSSEES